MVENIFSGWTSIVYIFLALAYFFFIFRLNRSERAKALNRPLSDADCLWRLARKRECSEYDIFGESTGNWQVPRIKIEEDFKGYLINGDLPYYVRDYLRKNRGEVDGNFCRPATFGHC